MESSMLKIPRQLDHVACSVMISRLVFACQSREWIMSRRGCSVSEEARVRLPCRPLVYTSTYDPCCSCRMRTLLISTLDLPTPRPRACHRYLFALDSVSILELPVPTCLTLLGFSWSLPWAASSLPSYILLNGLGSHGSPR